MRLLRAHDGTCRQGSASGTYCLATQKRLSFEAGSRLYLVFLIKIKVTRHETRPLKSARFRGFLCLHSRAAIPTVQFQSTLITPKKRRAHEQSPPLPSAPGLAARRQRAAAVELSGPDV